MITDNPREKRRPLFFLTGLVVALSLVIIVMQSSTLIKVDNPKNDHPVPPAEDTIDMPITIRKVEKAPEKKVLKNLAPDPSVDPDVILQVPDNEIVDTEPFGGEEPVDIGIESGLEEVEPLPPAILEFIAVPHGCADAGSKEEKLDCTNLWIQKYLRDNLKYPAHLAGIGVNDKVYISFVVSPTGEITDVQVQRGQYKELNAEARKALEKMPDWIPARQYARTVPMRMSLPVQFSSF